MFNPTPHHKKPLYITTKSAIIFFFLQSYTLPSPPTYQPLDMPEIHVPNNFAEILVVAILFLLILIFRDLNYSPGKAARPTTLTIRVSHIPGATRSDQFLEMLETLVSQRTPPGKTESEKNIILWSFAPSATSVDRQRECVATVTFREIPPFLSISGHINLKGGGLSFTVVVDPHFFGLTPLSNPVDEITVEYV